jgi:hypothetical protein
MSVKISVRARLGYSLYEPNGGGMKLPLGAGVLLKGEYLYYSFGNWAYDLTPLQATTNGNIPFFTAGVTVTTRNLTPTATPNGCDRLLRCDRFVAVLRLFHHATVCEQCLLRAEADIGMLWGVVAV